MARKRKPTPAQQSESLMERLSKHPAFQAAFPDGFTLRDEANAIVAYAFRNGPLEDLHAGWDSELLSDQSLSRITDAEMKTLMLDACRKMEELLRKKETDPDEYRWFIASYGWRFCRRWERGESDRAK